jgi:hypothetical protein
MLIDKIKGISSILNSNKSAPIKSSNSFQTNDNIEISKDAILKAEISNLTNFALNSESLNSSKLEDIKTKLKNGFYDNLNEDVLKKTADKLVNPFKEID